MMLLLMDHLCPLPWLNISAGTGSTGYCLWWCSDDDTAGAVQYSVHCTISCPRKPGVVLKAVTCPGLSHVSMPSSRTCISKSGGGLHGVLSFTPLFQFRAVWGTSALLPLDSHYMFLGTCSHFLKFLPVWISHPFICGSVKFVMWHCHQVTLVLRVFFLNFLYPDVSWGGSADCTMVSPQHLSRVSTSCHVH